MKSATQGSANSAATGTPPMKLVNPLNLAEQDWIAMMRHQSQRTIDLFGNLAAKGGNRATGFGRYMIVRSEEVLSLLDTDPSTAEFVFMSASKELGNFMRFCRENGVDSGDPVRQKECIEIIDQYSLRKN